MRWLKLLQRRTGWCELRPRHQFLSRADQRRHEHHRPGNHLTQSARRYIVQWLVESPLEFRHDIAAANLAEYTALPLAHPKRHLLPLVHVTKHDRDIHITADKYTRHRWRRHPR